MEQKENGLEENNKRNIIIVDDIANDEQVEHPNNIEKNSELIGINDIFMIDGVSYKVVFYNQEKKRYAAEMMDRGKVNLNINDLINIKNKWYCITYIHNTKKRISFTQN